MKNLLEAYGDIKIIKDLGMEFATEKSRIRTRFCIVECTQCKKQIRRQVSNVKNGTRLCISCRTIQRNIKHNMCNTSAYHRWSNMKNRCYSEKDKSFQDYGGRGIKVAEEWLNDFSAYFNYVSGLDNAFEDGLSIDRIDNNGDYKVGNLKWSTATEQNLNKRIQKNNKTGVEGIHFSKRDKKYIPRVTIGKRRRKELGRFKTMEEAKKCLDEYNEKEYLPQ